MLKKSEKSKQQIVNFEVLYLKHIAQKWWKLFEIFITFEFHLF